MILLDVVVVKKSELTRGAREKKRERERESVWGSAVKAANNM